MTTLTPDGKKALDDLVVGAPSLLSENWSVESSCFDV